MFLRKGGSISSVLATPKILINVFLRSYERKTALRKGKEQHKKNKMGTTPSEAIVLQKMLVANEIEVRVCVLWYEIAFYSFLVIF